LTYEDIFIDFIVLVLRIAEENQQYSLIDIVLNFIKEKITNTEFSIKIVERLLKEFKSGKINQWALLALEILLEIRRIKEREESKRKVSKLKYY